MDKPANNPAAARERKIILFLCLLAAAHVFIFSAAFPFFNNVDEQIHFDLAVKYAQGHVPRALESVSDNAVNYIVLYAASEYVGNPTNYPDGQFPPPPWTQPLEKIRPALVEKTAAWRAVTNYEASQPPLYYTLAALWWNLGKICGLHDGGLLYWLRFLDVTFIITLVWLGYLATRLIFPENKFLQISVPALIAFMPQTAFYSIQNDVLSPLCFGAAFICLVKLMRAEIPGVRLGIFTGLALAATFLTKISNLPLLAVSALVILFKASQLVRSWKISRRAAVIARARSVRRTADGRMAGSRGANLLSEISPARRKKSSSSAGHTSRLANGGIIRFSRRTVCGHFCPASWRRSGRANSCGIASHWLHRLPI